MNYDLSKISQSIRNATSVDDLRAQMLAIAGYLKQQERRRTKSMKLEKQHRAAVRQVLGPNS